MKNSSRFADSKKAKVTSPENEKNVDFNWGVKIPMRDGVQLNATIYKPKSVQPTSVIFTLTPYIADSYHPRVQKIAIFYRTRNHPFHLFYLLKSGRMTEVASTRDTLRQSIEDLPDKIILTNNSLERISQPVRLVTFGS